MYGQLVQFCTNEQRNICLILKSHNSNYSWNIQKLNNLSFISKLSHPRSLLTFRLWDETDICWKHTVNMTPECIMCSCLIKDSYIFGKFSRTLMIDLENLQWIKHKHFLYNTPMRVLTTSVFPFSPPPFCRAHRFPITLCPFVGYTKATHFT